MDGWDVDDNPVKEHFQHSRQCGWAILKYTKFLGEDAISFTDKELQDAREATFGSWWPHEQKRGWFSKIKKAIIEDVAFLFIYLFRCLGLDFIIILHLILMIW